MNQRANTTAIESLPVHEAAAHVQSRDDFLTFARSLVADLQHHPEQWENRDLASFLSALAAWVGDMDGYFQSQGESVPNQPTWKTLAHILLAARVYE